MTDTTVRIAWLGLLDCDDATGNSRAHDHLVALAQQVAAASGFGWSIELVSCGGESHRRSVSAGVERVTLPIAGVAKTVWDRTSWELPAIIAGAVLVHLHDGFSRSCELALLLAKQLRKPLCVTHWGIEGHWLSSELSLVELADVVVCHGRTATDSPAGAELVRCDVDIRQIGVPAPWPANHCREDGLLRPSSNFGDSLGRPTSDQYVAAGKSLYHIYHRLIANSRRAAA